MGRHAPGGRDGSGAPVPSWSARRRADGRPWPRPLGHERAKACAARRRNSYSGAAATEEDLDTFSRDVEPYGKLGIDTVIISPHLGPTSQ